MELIWIIILCGFFFVGGFIFGSNHVLRLWRDSLVGDRRHDVRRPTP